MDTDADRRELVDEKPEEMDWREQEPQADLREIVLHNPADMQEQSPETDRVVINHEEQ